MSAGRARLARAGAGLAAAQERYRHATGPAGLLALAILAAVIAWPGLRLPWSLIDDGWAQQTARTMDAGIRSGNLVSLGKVPAGLIVLGPDGRVRPITLLCRWAEYRLFGDAPAGYHALRTVEFALTTVLLAALAQSASRSWLGGAFAGLVWVFNAPNVEHWMRLFTQEPLLLLACGASIWLILNALRLPPNRSAGPAFAPAAVCLLAGYLVKETAVFMLPTAAALWLFTRPAFFDGAAAQRRLTTYYFGLNIGLTVGLFALIRLVRPASGGYTAYFDPRNVSQMVENGGQYLLYLLAPIVPLIPLAALAALVLWRARRWRGPGTHSDWAGGPPPGATSEVSKTSEVWPATQATGNRSKPPETRIWAAIFLAWLAAWLLIFLPWGSPQAYYMLGASFVVCLMLGWLTVAAIRRLPPGYRPLAAGIAVICLGGYIALNATWQQRFISGYQERGRIDADLVQYLAAEVPANGRVWFNVNPALTEWGSETDTHLALFHDRADVAVHFLGETPGPAPGDFVVGGMRDARLPTDTLLQHLGLKPAQEVTLGEGALAWWVVQVAANGEGS